MLSKVEASEEITTKLTVYSVMTPLASEGGSQLMTAEVALMVLTGTSGGSETSPGTRRG